MSRVGRTVGRCAYLVVYCFLLVLAVNEDEPKPSNILLAVVCIVAYLRHTHGLYRLFIEEREEN